MFASVKIWDCHGNLLRVGLAVCMPLTLDKHLSDRSLWADCHSVGRKPGNIRRSFSGRTLQQKPNDSVPFGFVLCRLGFVRRHRVFNDHLVDLTSAMIGQPKQSGHLSYRRKPVRRTTSPRSPAVAAPPRRSLAHTRTYVSSGRATQLSRWSESLETTGDDCQAGRS